ncbi:MAG TPA: RsmE family RNA methyltransferase [Dehalococcoidia bacterium]|nr:RsmE family RNA methyltransferase [Dehalococcoidia bacterium]
MNLVLFDPSEVSALLPRLDRRARHVLDVLRCGVGDSFDAGLIEGPRGKATIVSLDGKGLTLEFDWGDEPSPLDPITLVVGLPRPQTARKILGEATAMGVRTMHFVTSRRGEASYARSKLWTTHEWRRHLIDGAAQAFTTRLPEITVGRPLREVLDSLSDQSCRLALDNYEAGRPLSGVTAAAPVVLALGPERGWSAEERDLLRASGFELVHLGDRVLRVETACVLWRWR